MQSQQRPQSTPRKALKPDDLSVLTQVQQRDQALIPIRQQVLAADYPEKGGVTLDKATQSKANS